MNTVILTGRLAGDAEIRTFESGKMKASFTLAVNREYNKEETDFLPCVIWGNLAKTVSEYCGKGSLVAVRGSLERRMYEKDGEKRYIYEVNAQKVDFLETKKKEEKPEPPPIEEEAYYQPSIDEDDSAMLPFSLE